MNVKVFNIMSRVNDTKFIVQHESCRCKCRLNESVCNTKQEWHHNDCKCECKEINVWSSWKDDDMWNHGMCDCKCNKGCKIDEYLVI